MVAFEKNLAAHRGHLVDVRGPPDPNDPGASLREHRHGVLLVGDDGRILAAGSREGMTLPEDAVVVDHGEALILPGFIDCHVHFPQVYARHGYGGGDLLSWLERTVFPAEARLEDPVHARNAARDFCDALIRHGTTCALIFGSQFPSAQAELFAELEARGLRAIAGRTMMVRGEAAAASLLTNEEDAIALSREEIETWHPRSAHRDESLLHAAIVPRFAQSLTIKALAMIGELYAEYREAGVYLTTHLSEDARPGGEIEQTLAAFGVRRYLDVYDGRLVTEGRRSLESLLGRRSIFAHGVHCDDNELERLAASGSAIAHCPTSQLFLGTGTMPWRRTRAFGVHLGLGTDFGAGDTFSIPEVINACFKVHQSEPANAAVALHPAELLHLATLGGARALALDHRIGNFEPGKEADFVVFEPREDPLLARRLDLIEEQPPQDAMEQRLFAMLMGIGRLRPRAVYVRGRALG